MKKYRRLFCIILAMVLALSGLLTWSLAATDDQLRIDLRGMYLTQGYNWRSVPLHGIFDVADAQGNYLGQVAANPTAEDLAGGVGAGLNVPQGQLVLTPRAETLPEGYALESQYVFQAGASSNKVTILAYKQEGLFALRHTYEDGTPAAGAQFALVDGYGRQSALIETDENGYYMAAEPVPVGTYGLYTIKAAQGAVAGETAQLQVETYQGQAVAEYLIKARKAPVDQAALGMPVITCENEGGSLYEGEQTYQLTVKNMLAGENSWPLTNYTVYLSGLTLVDTKSEPVLDKTSLTFSHIAYQAGTPGYQAVVQPMTADGHAAGNPVTLSDGQQAAVQGEALAVTYLNARGEAVVEAGFDSGMLTAQVTCAQRTPQLNAPRAGGVQVAAQAAYQVVYNSGAETVTLAGQSAPAIAVLPVAETFAIEAEISVDQQNKGVLILRNTGSRTLENGLVTVALPQGWALAGAGEGAQAVRMTTGDYLVLDAIEKLAPAAEMRVSFDTVCGNGQQKADLYVKNLLGTEPVKDNPQGLLFEAAQQVVDPARNQEGFAVFQIGANSVGSQLEKQTAAPIAGQLYEDLNGNGQKDWGEKGEAGLQVEAVKNGVTLRAFTQTDGSFKLPDSPQEGENLTFVLPAHMMAAKPNERQEIPYTVTCMIHGQVTVDGVPLAGVEVEAAGQKTFTDAEGQYRFSQLTAGTYEVSFSFDNEQAAAYGFKDGSRSQWRAAAVVLNEENKEAVISAEAVSLGSVTLTAQGLDGTEAVLSQNDGVVASGVFSDGKVTLNQLYPGDYQIAVTMPEGMMLASLNGYAYAQRGEARWNLGVSGGQNSLYQLELKALGGLEGEILWNGSENILVTIQGEQEAWSLETRGSIAFANLMPGVYQMSFTVPAGYAAGNENGWTVQSGVASLTVEVPQGRTASAAQIALGKMGSAAGQIFEDNNANGKLDGGESVKNNVAVSLYMLRGETYEKIADTVTDREGRYAFDELVPGTYRLMAQAPAGASFNVIGSSVIASDGSSAPFRIADGEQLSGLNGTLVTPTSLKAVVFWDSNENGSRGIYERAVEGVTVSVIDLNGIEVAVGKTNYEGETVFKKLLPGVYKVRFSLPEGYAFSAKGQGVNAETSAIGPQDSRVADTDPITLAHGGQSAVGAGVLKIGTISGRVWYDMDADGIMAGNEPGVAGVVVQLVPRGNGGTAYEQTTNEKGEYKFDSVRPDSYDIKVTAPDGMMFTRYSKTGRDLRSIFTSEGQRTGEKVIAVPSGKVIDNQNIGLVTGSVIEGVVFLDPDYDGLYQSGDEVVAGVRLELEKISTGDKVGSVTTGKNGTFRFEALRGGNYRLKATLPDGSLVFTHAVSTDTAGNWFEARADRQDSTLQKLVLDDMEQKMMYVGAVRTGTISGKIYMDDDYSATCGKREAAAANLNVTLVNGKGKQVSRAITGRDGTYRFEGLVPGDYQVQMEAKEGYVFTKLGEGNLVTSLSDEGDGATGTLNLAMGADLTGVDGGLVRPGQVSGMIFNDQNDNGLQDNNEGGLAGVMVSLINQEDGVTAFQVKTGEAGTYSFNRVMPGTYAVQYELPEGGAFSPVEKKGNQLSGDGLTALSDSFSFKMADKKTMPLSGGLVLARLSGCVYEDLNGSGAYEEGERFLPGVQLVFDGQQQVTGEDGSFSVVDIHPGSYAMTFGNLEGYVFTRNGEDIAPRGQSAFEDNYKASAGQWHTELMIGMTPGASVSGYIWMDEDLSGSWNEMDTMLAGMEVTLRDKLDRTTQQVVMTDEEGCFRFEGIVPGSYDAVLTLPDGCIAAQAGYATFLDQGNGQLAEPEFQISAGEEKTGLSAGIVQYTILEGMVWQDEAGEPVALAGATVELTTEDGQIIESAVSNKNGRYQFPQVLPGDYVIKVQLPQGYLLVNDQDERVTSGLMMSIIETDYGAEGRSYPIHVVMGAHESDLDIGAVKPGMLGDKAWLDENGNGWQDTTEAPMPGITIRLLKDGMMIHERVTDLYGYYLFENVYPSTYDVEIIWHDELVPTRQRSDLAMLASQLEESDETSQVIADVEIRSNVKNFNFDLGFKLREEGEKPEAMQPAPKQIWK